MILLDTHAVIWMASDPERLSRAAAATIRKAVEEDAAAISAITLWEVAWLAKSGRLVFSGTLSSFVERITGRTAILPVTARIAVVAAEFPESYPKDPVDRIIGATAVVEGISLVTKDASIRRSGLVKTVW